MDNLGFIVSAAATLLTAVQFIPQAYDVVRRHHVKGVSLGTYAMACASASLWIVHGVRNGDTAIIAANTAILICAALIVHQRLTYKDKKRK